MHGLLDFIENDVRLVLAIDTCQNMLRRIKLTYGNEVTRTLWHEADKDSKESCRYHFGAKHIAPACSDSPGVAMRQYFINTHANTLYLRHFVVAEDKEINEIDNQLTEDNSKLVPANEHTTYLIR